MLVDGFRKICWKPWVVTTSVAGVDMGNSTIADVLKQMLSFLALPGVGGGFDVRCHGCGNDAPQSCSLVLFEPIVVRG